MSKKLELQKHTLNLRPGDIEFLQDFFAEQGTPASVVVRRLVSKYVDQLKTQLEAEDE